MKVSAKARYGLAAVTYMSVYNHVDSVITIISIADKLGISKIYLEQTFSLLKKAGIVSSIKGAQGGYRLAKNPKEITVFEVLSALDTALFEQTEPTVKDTALSIEDAMQELVFSPLAQTSEQVLKAVTLHALAVKARKNQEETNFMFYI